MMTDELRTFECIETPFRHFIQSILREKEPRIGIENILILYGFDSDIFCSIDFLFLWQR